MKGEGQGGDAMSAMLNRVVLDPSVLALGAVPGPRTERQATQSDTGMTRRSVMSRVPRTPAGSSHLIHCRQPAPPVRPKWPVAQHDSPIGRQHCTVPDATDEAYRRTPPPRANRPFLSSSLTLPQWSLRIRTGSARSRTWSPTGPYADAPSPRAAGDETSSSPTPLPISPDRRQNNQTAPQTAKGLLLARLSPTGPNAQFRRTSLFLRENYFRRQLHRMRTRDGMRTGPLQVPQPC